jgi:hypothetical protein
MKEGKKKNKSTNDPIEIAEEMSKKYLEECQKIASKFQQEASIKGLSPVEISGSLFINHASIIGSLMVSSLIAHAQNEKVEGLTASQVIAFLKYYQKEMAEVSQESFYEGMKKSAGIDMKKLMESDSKDVSLSLIDSNDKGSSGGMIH